MAARGDVMTSLEELMDSVAAFGAVLARLEAAQPETALAVARVLERLSRSPAARLGVAGDGHPS